MAFPNEEPADSVHGLLEQQERFGLRRGLVASTTWQPLGVPTWQVGAAEMAVLEGDSVVPIPDLTAILFHRT
jgi:hypothetical protein